MAYLSASVVVCGLRASTSTFLAKCVRTGELSAKLSDEAARAEKTKKPASSKERVLLNCFQYAKKDYLLFQRLATS